MADRIKKRKEFLKFPFLVLLISLLITIGATYFFYQGAQSKDRIKFLTETSVIRNRLEVLLNTYVAMLKAGRGFVESSGELNQEKFAEFVASFELPKNHPGLQGIGYSKKINPDEIERLSAKMRADGFSDFRIFPDFERSEYQSIIYLEPLNERNRQAIGYDMSTELIRREAIERAGDSGEPAATGKVSLLQETEESKQAGFLIYVPVYEGGSVPAESSERKSKLKGFVYSPVRAQDFLDDVRQSLNSQNISFKLYDSEKSAENLLAQTDDKAPSEEIGKFFEASGEINIGGRKWTLEFRDLPAFNVESSTGWTPLIFVAGTLFSLIMFGLTYLESSARREAENFSEELQASEREKVFLYEREQQQRKLAEEASKSKDEFISIVSHELRTPLNSIAGWSKILHAENLSASTRKQALRKIDKNLRVQTSIVDELLDFSQILSGNGSLRREKLNFTALLEGEFEKLVPVAAEKEILLTMETNGRKIYFDGDEERLKKVIRNLISNAIKFTGETGKIVTQLKADDQRFQLTVTDSGQGIRPEALKHIFDSFKQADSSTTREHGGLGLGLAISKHIAELHGGSLTAHSAGEKQGATFTLDLPINGNQNGNKV